MIMSCECTGRRPHLQRERGEAESEGLEWREASQGFWVAGRDGHSAMPSLGQKPRGSPCHRKPRLHKEQRKQVQQITQKREAPFMPSPQTQAQESLKLGPAFYFGIKGTKAQKQHYLSLWRRFCISSSAVSERHAFLVSFTELFSRASPSL